MSNLFQFGPIILSSGTRSQFKIDCDAITPEDWAGFAEIAQGLVPPFRVAIPVPSGGNMFAHAMNRYANKTANTILYVDDVWTTGKSLMAMHSDLKSDAAWHDLVLFYRGGAVMPPYLTSLFMMNERIS